MPLVGTIFILLSVFWAYWIGPSLPSSHSFLVKLNAAAGTSADRPKTFKKVFAPFSSQPALSSMFNRTVALLLRLSLLTLQANKIYFWFNNWLQWFNSINYSLKLLEAYFRSHELSIFNFHHILLSPVSMLESALNQSTCYIVILMWSSHMLVLALDLYL